METWYVTKLSRQACLLIMRPVSPLSLPYLRSLIRVSGSRVGKVMELPLNVMRIHFLLPFVFIRFGVQSIKHANVLSEKIYFSALGGSKVAIFGGDGLDPLHFEVHMFLDPPDPPYMSKNAKMCYF